MDSEWVWGAVWGVVSPVVFFLVGAPFNLVGLTPPDFRNSRRFFYLAACILGGTTIVWQVHTSLPFWFRVTAGVLVWGLIGAGLPEALRWVNARERMVQQAANVPQNAGRLEPATDLVILSGEKIGRLVQIGDGVLIKIEDQQASELKMLFGDTHFLLEQVAGRLSVSMDVKNANGMAAGRLQRNQWDTAQPRGRILDRNYTADALEILDEAGDVLLQVKLLSDRVQIQGKWNFSDGTSTILMTPRYYPGHSLIAFRRSASQVAEADSKIAKMFKYPSASNMGILEERPVIVRPLTDLTPNGKNFSTQYEVEIVGASLPALSLTLKAATIQKMIIKDRQTGASVNAQYKLSNGSLTATIKNARKSYAITAVTSTRDRVFIYHTP